MVKANCAVGPVSSWTGDHTFVIVEIDDVDGVDIGAGETESRRGLACGTVDVTVLAGVGAVDCILSIRTGSHTVGGRKR